MAYSFLVFDFGGNEEAAQQARHKVEGWKQGFRLGNKILLKFERDEDGAASSAGDAAAKDDKEKKKAAAKKGKSEDAAAAGNVRVLIRLDFSDHEKLSLQRWLDRIPAEEAFKSAESEIIRSGDPEYDGTSERFDALD
jgi:hypothetical protein